MNLSDFYKKAITTGIENDPRGKDVVLKELERKRKEYEGLSQKQKETFDRENLDNPYADSRILYGTGEDPLNRILVGIDIEVGEVLLADTLRSRSKPVDLIVSHHPEGRAFANLHSVMYMQSDILSRFGVPINIAEGAMEGRIKEIERRLMPVNHTRAVDAARLLDIPFLCLHTPADNMVAAYLQQMFDHEKPYTLEDVVDLLRKVPEYLEAEKNSSGPKILLGAKSRKAGKVFVDMTGGTEGSKEIFQSLSLGGINTVVAMHLTEDHRKEAEKNHINVVIAGHIASDNVGVNLLLDALQEEGQPEIIECSGFRRVKRK
ncbi:MAG: NGG1p interacting factor NIF3 [Alphaproteobacteria bacterium]|uniref:NGG1p interacting factor NIF3 n=1 Tax=Candidatus Nitrobium versatile TaxID=2884831 RepID=A0A953M1K7_9BACT|nr:NGG1p interacting factor NIF3 [Candidatus Nitrobium versatile]